VRPRKILQIKLRYILTVCFTIVAVVPVLFLGSWVARTALNKELDAVREKHLVLADHTAVLLESYAHDVETAFDFFTTLPRDSEAAGSAALVAKRLRLRHFCIIDEKFRVIREIRPDGTRTPAFDMGVMESLMSIMHNKIAYSGVMANPDGKPTIYLIKRIAKNRIAMAAIGTEYIVELQKTIAFGDRGHAVIVDHQGKVIAHPNDAWRKQMKNIANLEPVKHMIVKERGVTTFYSPTMKADMIAGFSTVAQTGWGVMVPQPIDELVAKAADVKRIALALVLCGILAAAFVSWLLAKRLTKPLEALQTTAQRIANGKLNSRVPPLPRYTASDICGLANDFNEMADRIQSDQKTLATALSRAQAADRAKTMFLANMSHELRTPLNAIIGFSQTMENQLFGPIGNERYVNYATDIRHSGEHLLTIINYILDLSKIEGGDITLEDDVIDIAKLVASVHAMLKGAADESHVALAVQIAKDLPKIRGSEVKLKQTLVNLVSNAVKYTPAEGSVVIDAALDHGDGVSIGVRDTGVGMTKTDLSTALLPFGRVPNEMSDRVNGAGLGLPLAKRFTELHGGRLDIESTKGMGTTVTLHLPSCRIISHAA